MLAKQIREILESGLPGEASHQKMAPLNRPLSSLAVQNSENIKESSVAILIIENDSIHEIVLIQRPVYDGSHSGQVSFPGGKKDDVDNDLLETAIRECYEEIGVRLEVDHYVGRLTPVFIPVSNFHVEANLFYLDSTPNFKQDSREVDSIFTIKLKDLLKDENVKSTTIHINDKFSLKNVPYFDLENKIIWGATALMLNELKDILKQIKI